MSQTVQAAEQQEITIAPPVTDRPVLLFAGQGAQQTGMGRDLAESDPDSMQLWKDAEKISGMPLREIYWEGDEAAMADTRALQPALSVVNISLWRNLYERAHLTPLACAGHSLGEFSALACAGVLSPADAIRITSLRGRLMAESDPEGNGAMAAILKLDEAQVLDIVASVAQGTGEMIVAANYNTPGQLVISGTKNAVQTAAARARELKGRAIELKVSGAFHSPMMEQANRELEPLLHKVEWRDPRFPVFANVTGKPLDNGQAAKKSILRQMISPVFWYHLLRNLYYWGARWWMEISPRAVLGKMIGPSMAGLASQCETWRVDLVNSLSSIMNYVS